MSKPKFTKGPWYSYSHDFKDCLDEYYTEWGVSSSDTKRGICTMLGADSEDEINANAALIAAAPEMYAMLEELYDNLNRGMKYIISRRVKNGCPIDLARKCSASNIELARRIKALLKKARGEE